jgi:hypothetical protein
LVVVIDCVVAPVDQRYPLAEVLVRVAIPHCCECVIVGIAGAAFSITPMLAVPEHPLVAVTVTLYVPV